MTNKHEKYGKAVQTLMNSDLKGIYGAIGELCSVESKYALAMERALGRHIRSVVVDTDETAKKAIDILKQTRSGKADFFSIKTFNPDPNVTFATLVESTDDIHFALNLLAFDEVLKPIFSHILDNTIICEDFEAALKYKGEFRIVLLDGTVIEKSGSISGGTLQPKYFVK